MKIAIIGCRHNHIFSLYRWMKESGRVEFAGAYEADEPTRLAAEKSPGLSFPYASVEEVLADKTVDAVAIGDYYSIRGSHAIAALRAGKHVIADKPICTSLSELDEIEALSRERGLAVGAMLDMRCHKNVLAAKQLIEEGTLGRIHNIQFGGQHPLSYGTRPSWYFEEGKHGGVINDIAIHGIDLLTYLTGERVERINAARTYNAYATEVPHFLDCGQMMLTLTGGIGVLADVSYSAPTKLGYTSPFYWEFHIWGERGMLSFSYGTDGVTLYGMDAAAPVTVPPIAPGDTILDAFLDQVEGKPTRLSTAEVLAASRKTLEIQRLADESAH
ncbi:MAG: Gfo/Idh/MocA family oxidoreductase [Clostridia bacterium]|nr:Gfo/Idh/MocA family oxidoreductase [Clostridia bacterium]